jgi:CRP/FNR family transcriptional regulator
MCAMEKPAIQAAFRGAAECRSCAIRHLVLFSGLQEQEFALIHRPIDDLTLPPGAILYHQGQTGGALFTVRTGLVKLVQYAPDGCQRIVRLLRPGDVAGLEALVSQPYQHEAVAVQAIQVCRLPVEVVHRLDRESPGVHRELMTRWQRALTEADHFLTELSTGPARARVSRLLLRLVEAAGEGETCTLLGREDIGAMLAITTETASRTIAAFKREGLLSDAGHDRVRCDVQRLRELAGD